MRLFVAVVPDEAALDALARAVDPLRELPGGPRWTARSLWHLTVAFLGEVDPDRLPRLEAALEAAARATAPFELRLSGAGTFPPSGAARVLWTSVAGDVPTLRRLAAAVRRAARSARVEPDGQRYTPHLTLGRWRPGAGGERRGAGELAGYQGPASRIDELVLFRSHLGPAPRHERLRGFPLAGGHQA